MQTFITVRGYHIDVYQHVNNARYLEFLEEARWQWLQKSALFDWMTSHRIAFVVVNININYRQPAVLGDELRIDGILLKIGARSGTISQTVTRVADNAIIADATLTFVCIDLVSQRALPLEGPLLEHLDAIRQA
ncbi:MULTISPECIES: acyl-CoA thioesterase [Brenneria]|uniref:Acyl-CoA thioesterase n=1 Tax=Brenneria nigrifluens DSM 30175 = ATCC 13028 TaxID=1121120 RepID=A0A2U1UW65_9GAMM|nr:MULTISPECIES: thioesterase family protein [Brenneria]EHD22712.1 4-hydroxybenzoyl-CoA thioesterase [Brenneria sp. EniD312]PWC25924.1 acyl-CoA thioesterase [Brenneria nigrifluens] [Brenneria nigrifluens DSM 30175 = ATCC 13028]QCR05689.1 acyl-CoA thioesterase [Brenneria nigrifluens] [Brenneria nigrifluens DSM 30175 = ATCC 13028]